MISILCLLAVALVWLLFDRGQHWEMSVIFMSLWWTMLLAETVIAALRNQSAVGNAVATLLATAGYVTASCWLIGRPPAGGLGERGARRRGPGATRCPGRVAAVPTR